VLQNRVAHGSTLSPLITPRDDLYHRRRSPNGLRRVVGEPYLVSIRSQVRVHLDENHRMHRPPSNTPASIEDFRTSDWKAAACGSGDSTYFSRWNGLCTAAAAANSVAPSKAKILWLLADACSLRLDPQKLNEPLSATFEGTENAVSLVDFDDGDIALLECICPELDDPLLRARVADILWLLPRKTSKLRYAIIAIDAYRSTQLDGDSWLRHDSRNCWHRAIMLALQIGAPGAGRLDEMTDSILAAITTQLDAGDAAPSMIETMLDYGLAEDHLNNFAERLVARASRLLASDAGNSFFVARRYFSLAKRCFGLGCNQDRCADIDCAISDTFIGEATARMSGTHPSSIVAASFYADAVQALLAVPKKLRAARGIDEKLGNMRRMQRDIAMQSIGDFAPIRSEPVDLEDEHRNIQALISGKELTDALLVLAECWPRTSRKLVEEDARQRMKQFSSSRMFASQKLATDGRVIAKSPTAGDPSASSPEVDKAVWSQMVQVHNSSVSNAVQSTIYPALRQFVLEHLVTDDDLVNIVGVSGMVPAERIKLVAKGLKTGFEGDFVVALHLLVPQLEHLVRTHLQLKGAKTVTTSVNGLQMEDGLSTLVSLPEMNTVFGEDLAFEIRALFCDGFGPNLRNELAHGLLDEGALRSVESIYAWWFMFREIYIQYWYSPN